MKNKIVILGAGVSGLAAARLAALQGYETEILCDGDGRSLPECSFFVVSPGVHPLKSPLYAAAIASGKPMISELEFGFSALDIPVIAITGTNGKTTTTELTTHILQKCGKKVISAGNIGLPVSDVAADILEKKLSFDAVVAEVSNFQLELCENFAPYCAALLNLDSDHEDRYVDGFAGYCRTKQKIFRRVPPHLQVYGPGFENKPHRISCRGSLLFYGNSKLIDADDTVMSAPHNRANLAAALEISCCFLGFMPDLPRVLENFHPGRHRQEKVASRCGITFINDSKATNPAAVLACVEACRGACVLLLGGLDKGMDFSPLAAVAPKCHTVVVFGESREKIKAVLPQSICVLDGGTDFRCAVTLAARAAHRGENVVLSPACASMDMFKNYAERGDIFKTIAESLPEEIFHD